VHPSVLDWVTAALTRQEVAGTHVLEVGAYDVNGSVRPIIEAYGPATYTGVDHVLPCDDLPSAFDPFDVVISTEMLEHVDDWRATFDVLCRMVEPGGLLLVTTRSEGFPYHPFPVDCWRYSVHGMERIVRDARFDPLEVCRDPQFPGVFVKARKPDGWTGCGQFSGEGVTPVCG
jgi:SAM-dependent methyltransferase